MNYKEDLKNLKIFYKVFSNKELAEKLGISYNAVSEWIKRERIPKKYLETLDKSKNTITNNGNNNININENNGNIHINSNEEMNLEICNLIKRLNANKKKYIYHLIMAEILRDEGKE